jgi:hypothetical protein
VFFSSLLYTNIARTSAQHVCATYFYLEAAVWHAGLYYPHPKISKGLHFSFQKLFGVMGHAGAVAHDPSAQPIYQATNRRRRQPPWLEFQISDSRQREGGSGEGR